MLHFYTGTATKITMWLHLNGNIAFHKYYKCKNACVSAGFTLFDSYKTYV